MGTEAGPSSLSQGFSAALVRRPLLAPWLAFALLLVAYDAVFSGYFPIKGYRLGHDYAYVLPNLLDGMFWFHNNGWSVPWFTPSFCAGQPGFPDPQSAYYALPQLLALMLDPLAAAFGTLLIAASLMYWGGALLMRKVFGTGWPEAILVGGLLMFNGFLSHRLMVGHMGYHGFALVPWLALLLLVPCRARGDCFAAAAAAGGVLAYWVYSGLGTLILASTLAVVPLAILRFWRGGSVRDFALRTVMACGVGTALAAAKLAAAFSLMAQLPRDFYPLPGANGPGDAVLMVLGGLFLPSQWVAAFGMPRLTNVMWAVAAHEWAYGFGMAAAALALLLVVAALRRGMPVLPAQRRGRVLLVLFVAVLLWPLAFSTWHPAWNAFLKNLPLLGSASFPLRWTIVYIPVTAAAIGLAMTSIGRRRVSAIAICLLATVLGARFEPRDYYLGQAYDVRPVVLAADQFERGELLPRIAVLGTTAEYAVGRFHAVLKGNDTFIRGMSQLGCYNPIFGYRLEKFLPTGLAIDDVLRVSADGYLNLKNPACYVYPRENACRPGDRFRADQIEAAKAFVAYRPWAFAVSMFQQAANIVTLGAFGLVLVGLAVWSTACFRRRLLPPLQ